MRTDFAFEWRRTESPSVCVSFLKATWSEANQASSCLSCSRRTPAGASPKLSFVLLSRPPTCFSVLRVSTLYFIPILSSSITFLLSAVHFYFDEQPFPEISILLKPTKHLSLQPLRLEIWPLASNCFPGSYYQLSVTTSAFSSKIVLTFISSFLFLPALVCSSVSTALFSPTLALIARLNFSSCHGQYEASLLWLPAVCQITV